MAKVPSATFEVRFIGSDLAPEKIPLRAVSDALSAVQDLASGRDSFETQQVPLEKAIGLLRVSRGSAVYSCVAREPKEALRNLTLVHKYLSGGDETDDDGLSGALRPIESLSDVAKSLSCSVVVIACGRRRDTLFTVERDAYEKIAGRLFLTGETTVIGTVERAGGTTEMRNAYSIPGRRRILYCDVDSKDLVRRLGQHLYEEIAAVGTAVWLNRSWRIHKFTIRDFAQPRFGNVVDTIRDLRQAGLSTGTLLLIQRLIFGSCGSDSDCGHRFNGLDLCRSRSFKKRNDNKR